MVDKDDKNTTRVKGQVALERALRSSVDKAIKAFDKALKKASNTEGSETVVLNSSIKMMDTYFKYEIDKEKLLIKGGGSKSVEADSDAAVVETDTVKVLKRPGA